MDPDAVDGSRIGLGIRSMGELYTDWGLDSKFCYAVLGNMSVIHWLIS